MSVTFFRCVSTARYRTVVAALTIAVLSTACGDGRGGFRPKVGVGDPAPKSHNRLADVSKWYEVSTMDRKVPLYRWEIASLIETNQPFLVVFGTPQHCTMCVDQIVRVAIMQEKYGDQFAFIHVDGYKDNEVWVQWGVKGEPWTFIVDQAGIVSKVYPGQTELALLENEVQRLLKASS